MESNRLLVQLGMSALLGSLISGASAEQVAYNGVYMDASEAQAMPVAQAVAQNSAALPDGKPGGVRYGLTNWVTYTVGPGDFVNRPTCGAESDIDLPGLNSIGPKVGATQICVGAPVHLPTGARIEWVTLAHNDTHVATNPSAGFYKSTIFPTGGSSTSIVGLTPTGTYSAGHRWEHFAVSPAETVTDNWHNTYNVLAILGRNGTEVQQIYGVVFWYSLQVSPAPATATFTDVPTSHWAFQYVESLASSGITTGTSSTTFSPDTTVTRAQLAVFLSRALGLHWKD